VPPGDELCDGVDNDCDGATDELPVDKGLGEPCGGEEGACRAGVLRCVEGALSCDGEVGPSAELCNGVDDDCDGLTDEAPGDPELGQRCGSDQGVCRLGTHSCVDGAVVCAGEVAPGEERCNGQDDDCDGAVDEGPVDESIGAPCGVAAGECRPGRWACEGGGLVCVGGAQPGAEVCNGADDDCDGATDEDLEAPEVGAPCGAEEGRCRAGLTECVAGWIVCAGAILPEREVCDGADNDCDGATDEDPPEVGKPCGSDVGACQAGTTLCVEGRLVCGGGVLPAPELCDGVDNDCNGQVDEQPGDPTLGDPCGSDEGECSLGVVSCIEGQVVCYGDGGPAEELCDGIDNDCDGAIDEGSLDAGLLCGEDEGECVAGVTVCRAGQLSCFGAVPPEAEVCDGADNDCDGGVDEGDPGGGQVCGSDVGECSAGLTACVDATLQCAESEVPEEEVCNGLDDDCDGATDEGALQAGQPCGSDAGECRSGTTVCRAGEVLCAGEQGPVDERCDGLDNDCDGVPDDDPVDPGLGEPCGSDVGPCSPGLLGCELGQLVCLGAVLASPEACDAVDNDCDGTVDNGADAVCEEEQGPGYRCTEGECVSGCAEDAWEPNDSPNTPAELPDRGEVVATACAWDEDFFRLPGCAAGTRLWVSVAADPGADAPLGVQLLDGTGQALPGGSGSGQEVPLLATLPMGEDAVLRVFPVFGGVARYTLRWDALCLQDDPHEENDEPRPDAETLAEGAYPHLVLLPGDEDWFPLEVPAECEGGTLEAALAFVHHPHGDLDLELLSQQGERLAASSGTGDAEGVVLADGPAGRYWLRVHGFKQSGNRYELTVSLACPTAGDDLLEENDTPRQAAQVPFGHHGQLAALDEDWYLVAVDCPGATLSASLTFAHAAGDLDLQVLDRSTPPRVLAASTTLTDDEQAVVEGVPEGELAVRVYGFQGARNSYEMDLELQCPPPPDDAFEDNDLLEQASPWGPSGTFSDLVLAANDDDWFRVEVDAACAEATLQIEVDFEARQGDIDISLHAADGARLGGAAGGGDSERLVARALDVGSYFVRVYSVDDVTLPYALRIVRSCRAPGDDPFEENDTLAQATPIPTGRWEELVSLDDDWYRLDVGCVAAVVEAGIAFEHDQGDLDLWLGDGQGRRVAQSVGVGDQEVVLARDRPAGSYLVRVYGYAQADNVYALWLRVSCPQEGDDLLEENDTAAQAAPLSPGTTADLVRLADDDDWFRFELGPGCGPAAVELELLGAEGQAPRVQLQLFGADGGVAAELDGPGVTVVRGLPDGGYLARVTGAEVDAEEYGLRLVRSCMERGDDPLEQNDTAAQALALAPGRFEGLALLPGDQDWYRLEVPAECEQAVLEAGIFFAHAIGDLDLALLDTELTPVRAAQSVDDDETILVEGLAAGGYLLRVSGWGDAGAPYDLLWALSCFDPHDDDLEQNDTLLQASPVQPGVVGDLVLTPGDPDWFALPAPCDGAHLWAEVTFEQGAPPGAGTLVHIADATGLPAPATQHPALEVVALAPAMPAAPWYVLLVPPADLPLAVPYALDVGWRCPAEAVINELALATGGPEAALQAAFVELHAPPDAELGGWRLVIEPAGGAGGAGSVLLEGCRDEPGCRVPQDGLLVVAHPASRPPDAPASPAGAAADLLAAELSLLDAQAGSVVLQRPAEGGQWLVVDSLGYGDGFDPPASFAGEGRAAPTPAAGHSIARGAAGYDSDDNLRDFVPFLPPGPGLR